MSNGGIYKYLEIQMFVSGVTSEALAKGLGITYRALREKLRGIRPISIAEAKEIRKILRCENLTLDYLFYTDDDNFLAAIERRMR